jgi:hypothetical protein
MSEIQHDALDHAARLALRAPSIFNTQPWTWRIDGIALELRPDWSRQLRVTDSLGNELLLSCGAALHHARVALAADGWRYQVERMRPGAREVARSAWRSRARRIRRRSGCARRSRGAAPTGGRTPTSPSRLTSSRRWWPRRRRRAYRCIASGTTRCRCWRSRSVSAGAAEMAEPDYVNELIRWTNRPEWSNDGVPPATAVRKVPRRVPVREFAVAPYEGMPVAPGGDRGAAYLILHGPDAADPVRWLRAGEALSAVLLTAVSRGLAVAPHHGRARGRAPAGAGPVPGRRRRAVRRDPLRLPGRRHRAAEAPRRTAEEAIISAPDE